MPLLNLKSDAMKVATAILLFLSLTCSAQVYDSIGRIQACDPDNDSLTWSIIAGNYGGYFKIVRDGLLVVDHAVYSKIASARTWRLSVQVTDPGGLSAWAYVTVTLQPRRKIGKMKQGTIKT